MKPNGYFRHYTKEINAFCHTNLFTSKGCQPSAQHTFYQDLYKIE